MSMIKENSTHKFKYTNNICNCLGEIDENGSSIRHIGLWLVDHFSIKPKIDDEIEYSQHRFGNYLWVKINGVLVFEWTQEWQNKEDIKIDLYTKNILESTKKKLGIFHHKIKLK